MDAPVIPTCGNPDCIPSAIICDFLKNLAHIADMKVLQPQSKTCICVPLIIYVVSQKTSAADAELQFIDQIAVKIKTFNAPHISKIDMRERSGK